MSAPEVLRGYLRCLLDTSGARAVTIFVPAGRTASTPLLVHAGDAPPAPELASVEEASKLDVAARPAASETIASRDPDSVLVPLVASAAGEPADAAESRLDERRRAAAAEDERPAGWLGVRLASDAAPAAERFRDARIAPAAAWWRGMASLGAALARHAAELSVMLGDPVSGLHGRAVFNVLLDREIDSSRATGRPLGLVSLNPDGFALVNERLGRESADEAIREFAARIRAALRASDVVTRFGGVIFMVVVPGADLEEAESVAGKVCEAVRGAPFLGGTLRIVASAGVAAFEPGRVEIASAAELVRRSDQALGLAKRGGGDRVARWEPGSATGEAESFDRLSGIFTGRMTTDYRNMSLLWDVMNILARYEDVETLAPRLVERIDLVLQPRRTRLFVRGERGELRLAHGIERVEGRPAAEEPREAAPEEERLLSRAGEGGPAFPLSSRDRPLGALLVERDEGSDDADAAFLAGLARQVGVALERAELAAKSKRAEEERRLRLERELESYRQATDKLQLVHRSGVMRDLLARTQQVASTDATVLISGESGTGKELLARTLHEMSPRRDKPLVVVDCSAIAATLAESELFGHEAGAYTGAAQRRVGRLAEADGGTVLLDEIGELPLEIQAKLLRFVQEKQFTSVGGNRQRRVDVRILAATNRDLESEAAAGRFRADLFHRLNVVSLVVPPLRERPDDILFLAERFVARLCTLHHRERRRLSGPAQVALLRHPWPGNVRELQHRILQAVIFSPQEELRPEDLGLTAVADRAGASPPGPGPQPVPADGAIDPWAVLQGALSALVRSAAERKEGVAAPIGRWLAVDLVLETEAAVQGVGYKGAALLGLPDATYRHRLNNARSERDLGTPRPDWWSGVRAALRQIVALPNTSAENRIERVESVLLDEIRAHVVSDTALASRLLGVTAQTFRRRTREEQRDGAPRAEQPQPQ